MVDLLVLGSTQPPKLSSLREAQNGPKNRKQDGKDKHDARQRKQKPREALGLRPCIKK
jgi:hypothetical protein